MYNSRCNCSSNSGRGSSCARNGERIMVNQSGCNTESRSRCSCVNTYRPGCGGNHGSGGWPHPQKKSRYQVEIMAAAAVITMTMTAAVETAEILRAAAVEIIVHARQDRVRRVQAVRITAVTSIAAV